MLDMLRRDSPASRWFTMGGEPDCRSKKFQTRHAEALTMMGRQIVGENSRLDKSLCTGKLKSLLRSTTLAQLIHHIIIQCTRVTFKVGSSAAKSVNYKKRKRRGCFTDL